MGCSRLQCKDLVILFVVISGVVCITHCVPCSLLCMEEFLIIFSHGPKNLLSQFKEGQILFIEGLTTVAATQMSPVSSPRKRKAIALDESNEATFGQAEGIFRIGKGSNITIREFFSLKIRNTNP